MVDNNNDDSLSQAQSAVTPQMESDQLIEAEIDSTPSDSPTEAVPDPPRNKANDAPVGSTSAMGTAGKFDVN